MTNIQSEENGQTNKRRKRRGKKWFIKKQRIRERDVVVSTFHLLLASIIEIKAKSRISAVVRVVMQRFN